jgi:hypothetical protein
MAQGNIASRFRTEHPAASARAAGDGGLHFLFSASNGEMLGVRCQYWQFRIPFFHSTPNAKARTGSIMDNRGTSKQSISLKFTENVREYVDEQGVSEEETPKMAGKRARRSF